MASGSEVPSMEVDESIALTGKQVNLELGLPHLKVFLSTYEYALTVPRLRVRIFRHESTR